MQIVTRYDVCVIAHDAGEQFSRSIHKNKHACRATYGCSCCGVLCALLFPGVGVLRNKSSGENTELMRFKG